MLRFSRSIFLAIPLALALLWPLAACEEEPDAASSVVINSWLQQGLGPADFQKLDGKALGKDAMCKQSKLKGLETTLCQYPDPAAASAARPAGLAHVGEVTGVALPVGNLLLIVADRDKADPSGRAINEIVTIFRAKAPRPAEPAKDKAEAEAETSGEKAGSGKSGEAGKGE
jgi:hypothetical protein